MVQRRRRRRQIGEAPPPHATPRLHPEIQTDPTRTLWCRFIHLSDIAKELVHLAIPMTHYRPHNDTAYSIGRIIMNSILFTRRHAWTVDDFIKDQRHAFIELAQCLL